jgi:protein Tex
MLPSIAERIASELSVRHVQVQAAIDLLDEGSTVPFIARYRKEATDSLDDTQLRHLDERLLYLRELEARRASVLETIEGQGKLNPALRRSIEHAESKQRLEDLYLPYKVKRRTRAQIAVEAGLEPLAELLFSDPMKQPELEGEAFLCEPFTSEAGDNPGVVDVKAALDGATLILMERFAEDADLIAQLREQQWTNALLISKVVEENAEKGAKFRDYFDYSEKISKVPPHRVLAVFRGRTEDVLRLSLKLPEEVDETWSLELGSQERQIATHNGWSNQGRPADDFIAGVMRMTWRGKLASSIESQLFTELRLAGEAEAIRVFARNLRDLLLAAPAGAKNTMGLDPGIRTGVKVAVVDGTGKLLDTATIYPFAPKNDTRGSLATLAALSKKHDVSLVAVGNGTASRETDSLITTLMKEMPELGLISIMVSEAGASVYSASELAAKEFPDLDVSIRGAVSIARRLQDPLAELVKIEPKSIGVGQYQHDANPIKLDRALDAVVEDCVNSVGVDVNTASAPLLARISGLSVSLAENVVTLRNERGAYRSRKELLEVPRLGPKAFEQAAGFLRIRGGDNPLDASAVHPEAYPVAQKMLTDLNEPIKEVMQKPHLLKAVNAEKYVDARFGLPTIQDILAELEKPGRDPRPEFKTAKFNDAVNKITDLTPDMVLEGVVTNVTNFGAFVDLGVHQDGLVHISALADRFVKDPHEVVKAGDIVKVKVMEVDVARKRIGLSMRLSDPAEEGGQPRQKQKTRQGQSGQGRPDKSQQGKKQGGGKPKPNKDQRPPPGNAMAEAFAKARKK